MCCVLLTGGPGEGKSTLARAVGAALWDEGAYQQGVFELDMTGGQGRGVLLACMFETAFVRPSPETRQGGGRGDGGYGLPVFTPLLVTGPLPCRRTTPGVSGDLQEVVAQKLVPLLAGVKARTPAGFHAHVAWCSALS